MRRKRTTIERGDAVEIRGEDKRHLLGDTGGAKPKIKVVGVRVGEEGGPLDAKLARLVAAAERATPGQHVSEGGVLRGLLQEAKEP